MYSTYWFVISAMGREAGHLAFGIGAACHFPMIIIPEMFNKTDVTFEKIINLVISAMLKRKILGIGFGAAIVSEGVFHFMTDEEIKGCGIQFSYDDHGHPELGNVSKAHIFNTLLQQKLKELGVEESLINLQGMTQGMLVILGQKNIKKLSDFADLSSDELIGGFDEIKGKKIRIDGYLEEFSLSRKEADQLIMSAREIVYK